MSRISRFGAAAVAGLALAISAPAVAHADTSESAPEPAVVKDLVERGMVQIHTTVTGVVHVQFSDIIDEWTDPITINFTCPGFAVDDTHMMTTRACTGGNTESLEESFRTRAAAQISERLHHNEEQTKNLDMLSRGDMWAVTASPGETGSKPKASATVRRITVEGLPPVSVPASGLRSSDAESQPFGSVTLASPIDDLTPLPVTETAPTSGDRVLMAAASSDDFAAAAPSVSIVEGTVTKTDSAGAELSIQVTSNDVGTVVLTPDGLVIGLMPSASEPWSTLPAALRQFAAADGVEPLSAYPEPEDESSNMWLWLGPVIGVVGLVVIGGVVFVVLRGRRRKAKAAAATAGFGFGSAPGQFAAPQQPVYGAPQQTPPPGAYPHQPAPPSYQTPPTPPPHQTPPPPAAPGSYDQTQIGQRPPTPPQ